MEFTTLTFLAMLNWKKIREGLPKKHLEEFDDFMERLDDVMSEGYTAFSGDLDEELFMAEALHYALK